jgi:hypothetical protein
MNKAISTLALASVIIISGCKGEVKEIFVLDDTDAVEASLDDVACDIEVIPLKSNEPFDGIGRVQFYGNKMFALNDDVNQIFYFENDSLVATLSKSGNGPGEYEYIYQYFYSRKYNQLYVYSSGRNLLAYTIPEMTFVDKKNCEMQYRSIASISDKQCIALVTSIVDDKRKFDTEPYYVVTFDPRTPDDTVRIIEKSVTRNYPDFSSFNTENPVFIIDSYEKKVCRYSNGKLETIFEFSLGKKGLPKNLSSVEEYLKDGVKIKDYYSEVDKYGFSHDMILKYNSLVVNDKTVSFFFMKSEVNFTEHGNGRMFKGYYASVNRGDSHSVYSRLNIPGLKSSTIFPKGVDGTSYVVVIDKAEMDPDSDLSPLAEEIIKAKSQQKDDNPLLLKFRFR